MNLRARLKLLATARFVGGDEAAAAYMADLIDALAYNIALWRVAQKDTSKTDPLLLAQEQLENVVADHERELRRMLDEAKEKRQADPEGSPHPPVGGRKG